MECKGKNKNGEVNKIKKIACGVNETLQVKVVNPANLNKVTKEGDPVLPKASFVKFGNSNSVKRDTVGEKDPSENESN